MVLPHRKKRDTQQLVNVNLTSLSTKDVPEIIASINTNFDQKISLGYSNRQALTQLAIETCRIIPKLEITSYIQEWFDMNGLSTDDLTRVCDSNTDRIRFYENEINRIKDREDLADEEPIFPSWVILLCTIISSFAVLLVVVSLILRKIRERPQVNSM